jgi:hypothetical protein
VKAFLDIAKARAQKLKDAGINDTRDNKTEVALFMLSFSMRDSIFSRRIELSVHYRLMATMRIILDNGGVFDPVGQVQGWSWQQWRDSRGVKEALDPRAYAKLKSEAGDEVLVSFCNQANFGTAEINKPKEQSYTSDFTGDTLTKENSWLKYQVIPRYEKIPATIMHRPAAASTDSQTPLQPANYGNTADVQGGTDPGYVPGGPGARQAMSIQERAPAEVIITLTGHAVRAGFPINTDSQQSDDLAYFAIINDQPANEIHAEVAGPFRLGFSPEKSDGGRRIPIYMVVWRRKYRAMSKQPLNSNQTAIRGIPASRQQWVKFPT